VAEYVAPHYDAAAFSCPFCGVYAHQGWFELDLRRGNTTLARSLSTLDTFHASQCAHCSRRAIWLEDKLIHPNIGVAPIANADMPAEVREDYDEANKISNQSPRGAAALLRLGIQKLCKHLGEPGTNINKDIAALVEKGLPGRVQKALDTVRVVGNDAVHPGALDIRDDSQTVATLFKLLNIIADNMITEPRVIDDVYETLLPSKREQIDRRDKKGK
jgi:hypothetical protein